MSLAKKTSGQQKRPQRAEPSSGAHPCNQQEVADHPVDSEHQLPFSRTDKEASDSLVYKICPFSCGDIAMVKELNTEVLIRDINIFTETAVTSVIRGGELVDDISITLPLSKMECLPAKPKGKIKIEGEELTDGADKATTVHFQNANFRVMNNAEPAGTSSALDDTPECIKNVPVLRRIGIFPSKRDNGPPPGLANSSLVTRPGSYHSANVQTSQSEEVNVNHSTSTNTSRPDDFFLGSTARAESSEQCDDSEWVLLPKKRSKCDCWLTVDKPDSQSHKKHGKSPRKAGPLLSEKNAKMASSPTTCQLNVENTQSQAYTIKEEIGNPFEDECSKSVPDAQCEQNRGTSEFDEKCETPFSEGIETETQSTCSVNVDEKNISSHNESSDIKTDALFKSRKENMSILTAKQNCSTAQNRNGNLTSAAEDSQKEGTGSISAAQMAFDNGPKDMDRKASLKLIRDVESKRFANILGHRIACMLHDDEVYISCDIFRVAGINTKSGYCSIDDTISKEYNGDKATFLVEWRKRTWVLKDALMIVLRKQHYGRMRKQLVLDCVQRIKPKTFTKNQRNNGPGLVEMPSTSTEEHSGYNGSCLNDSVNGGSDSDDTLCPDVKPAFVTLFQTRIPAYSKENNIYVEVAEIFKHVGFRNHVKKNKWRFIDKCIRKRNVDVESAFDNQRRHISFKALQTLLEHFRPGFPDKKKVLLKELENLLNKLSIRGLERG